MDMSVLFDLKQEETYTNESGRRFNPHCTPTMHVHVHVAPKYSTRLKSYDQKTEGLAEDPRVSLGSKVPWCSWCNSSLDGIRLQ